MIASGYALTIPAMAQGGATPTVRAYRLASVPIAVPILRSDAISFLNALRTQSIQPTDPPMKTHRLLFLTTTLALSLLATDTASAWRRPLVIARPTPKPKKVDASTQLTIVKAAGKSISVKGSTTTQAYKIDGHTLININGRKGSVGGSEGRDERGVGREQD